jgi:hypothetical protein
MAYMLSLKSFSDDRGRLIPIDRVLPFDIKRLYYIKDITDAAERGGHSHFLTVEAIFCVTGSFTVVINDSKTRQEYYLSDPSHCLIVEPLDWHMIYNFSPGAVLMGVSSTHYDHADYHYEEPVIEQPETEESNIKL